MGDGDDGEGGEEAVTPSLLFRVNLECDCTFTRKRRLGNGGKGDEGVAVASK